MTDNNDLDRDDYLAHLYLKVAEMTAKDRELEAERAARLRTIEG